MAKLSPNNFSLLSSLYSSLSNRYWKLTWYQVCCEKCWGYPDRHIWHEGVLPHGASILSSYGHTHSGQDKCSCLPWLFHRSPSQVGEKKNFFSVKGAEVPYPSAGRIVTVNTQQCGLCPRHYSKHFRGTHFLRVHQIYCVLCMIFILISDKEMKTQK